MNRLYLDKGKAAVFRDRSKGGLLVSFLREYKEQFGGGVLNVSCSKCRNDYWNNYENLFIMKEEVKCDYVLKAKYNAIFFKGNPIRIGELTNAVAKDMLENHPAGADLFEVIPKPKPKAKAKKKEEPKNEK